jgi:hypothetical protein
MFCGELQRFIDRKDKLEKVKGGPYARYILVVVTDESLLGREDVAQFLEGVTFRTRLITEAYFGLSYDPWVKSAVRSMVATYTRSAQEGLKKSG